MDKSQPRDDVAVFVDFENVYVSVREKFDATPNFELIMDRCEDYGRIILARAYADWYRYPRVTSALFANGVEPMYVPTYYYDREVGRTGRPIKNSVDIHLCIDVMRTLYTQAHIEKFVLVTGDRDFIPLVNAIRQHGKEVIVIGIGGAASAHLAQSADEFLFYEQIAELKNQQRQPEQRDRGERRERREEPRERSDGKNGKRERKEEPRQTAEQPIEQPVEQPTAKNVYDTLVDAIHLARQRGFVSNLGSLKVIMRELDSTFNETKLKDANGKPFAKFKEFVEEAQRLGKAQIFTNGTVTEVFLPGEDPYRMSQFADDFAASRAEQEIETDQTAEATESNGAASVVPALDEMPVEAAPAEEPIISAPLADVVVEIVEPSTSADEQTFDERDWGVLLSSMAQFSGPVRFIEIFGALRGARNQELVELTNNELKDLVKQAINRGLLQRTGRGAKAYYRLSAKARALVQAREDAQEAPAAQVSELVADASPEQATDEATDQQVNEQRSGKPRRRRRGRAREAAPSAPAPSMATATPAFDAESPEVPLEPVAEQVEQGQPAAEETELASPQQDQPVQMVEPGHEEPGVPDQPIEDLAAQAEALPEPVDQPSPELSQAMESFLEGAAPDAAEASVEALPTETVLEEGDTVVEQPPLEIETPTAEAGEAATPAPKKRRTRRRKPSAQNGDQPTAEAEGDQPSATAEAPEVTQGEGDQQAEAAPKKRRTRRKKTE